MKVKEESEKAGLKLNIQKIKIMASSPISLWQIDGETIEMVTDFIFGGSRITADGDCSHEIKRHLLLNQIPYDYTVEVRNRFKGLDLIDRVPNELWTEVHNIVQETGIKTIPMEKKCKKAKWLSGEALQIAVKRREEKSKGEKERYKHLNAEFQRAV